MILIADSGSTKTDWCLVENRKVTKEVKTCGINPFFQTEVEIAREIETALLPELPSNEVDDVFFYGAGCTLEKQPIVETALKRHLKIGGHCEVASDMLAAAHSLCGRQAGIACILGTGSNSCAYDGERITQNVSPLGFILGDEGSGAVLGKTLVGDVLKNQLPTDIIAAFHQQFGYSAAEIIDRVYRQKLPNRFLAGFTPFLKAHLDNPAIYQLVMNSFRLFLVRNVKQYKGWKYLPIGFTGSIAYHFQSVLKDALASEGMRCGPIMQAPMKGLVSFHCN